MTSMPWFRFYSEFRADPKMKRMPIHHRYAFIMLLCMANESQERGVILGLDDDDFAFELEMSTEDWLTLKAKFKAKGLINFGSGKVEIASWEKRQHSKPSDSPEAVKQRVARHRANKKEQAVTLSNALQNDTVTLATRFCNADQITDLDTDPDTHNQERVREESLNEPEPTPISSPTLSTQTESVARPNIPHESKFSAAPQQHKSRNPTEERFKRGAQQEQWEVGIKTPDPEFINWIVAHNKQGSSALPPKAWAKQMLYNSRDRGTILADSMWQEYQESLIAKQRQFSHSVVADKTLDLEAERARTGAKSQQTTNQKPHV